MVYSFIWKSNNDSFTNQQVLHHRYSTVQKFLVCNITCSGELTYITRWRASVESISMVLNQYNAVCCPCWFNFLNLRETPSLEEDFTTLFGEFFINVYALKSLWIFECGFCLVRTFCLARYLVNWQYNPLDVVALLVIGQMASSCSGGTFCRRHWDQYQPVVP